MRGAYAREFGATITRPAIYNEPPGGCPGRHITTTAYLRTSSSTARLLFLYLSSDGGTVLRQSQESSVIVPAGTFRFLSVIVKHPETVGTMGLPQWEAAQRKIADDHAAFAAGRGLAAPLVTFENTNLLVEPGEIADPRNLASVRSVVEQRGLASSSFQFIASINLDPTLSEGGFASAGGFIFMGNFSRWTAPLTSAQWVSVANAVYHHEVSHHWGWPGTHDWAPQCAGQSARGAFIVPPILFGWEDVDGDGVPEILDTTPYGRQP